MAIYTLTTDFGIREHYVAAVKGNILKLEPQATLIDISHSLLHKQWQSSAYVIHNAYPHFPTGTTHIIGINLLYSSSPQLIFMEHEGHKFIAPNNGILSLVFNTTIPQMYSAPFEPDAIIDKYPIILAQLAVQLASNTPLDQIGSPLIHYQRLIPILAFSHNNTLKGVVSYIDQQGNVISNISIHDFKKTSNGRKFSLLSKRNEKDNNIHKTYTSVNVGEKAIFFNSDGFLQISINNDSAANMLGLKLNDPITFQFYDN